MTEHMTPTVPPIPTVPTTTQPPSITTMSMNDPMHPSVTPNSKDLMSDNTVESKHSTQTAIPTKPKRSNTMADIMQSDLYTLFKDNSDIRRDVATAQSELRHDISQGAYDGVKETLKSTNSIDNGIKDASYINSMTTKDAAFNQIIASKDGDYNTLKATHDDADRLIAQSTQYFIAQAQEASTAAREIATLTATTTLGLTKLASDFAATSAATSAAGVLEAQKNTAALMLSQNQVERSIFADGNETRRLVNELRVSELERKLIERSGDIHGYRHEANHWRGNFDNSQFAALSNQIQMVGSVAQEARQGVTNFGNMSGNAGRQNATNNVA